MVAAGAAATSTPGAGRAGAGAASLTAGKPSPGGELGASGRGGDVSGVVDFVVSTGCFAARAAPRGTSSVARTMGSAGAAAARGELSDSVKEKLWANVRLRCEAPWPSRSSDHPR